MADTPAPAMPIPARTGAAMRNPISDLDPVAPEQCPPRANRRRPIQAEAQPFKETDRLRVIGRDVVFEARLDRKHRRDLAPRDPHEMQCYALDRRRRQKP